MLAEIDLNVSIHNDMDRNANVEEEVKLNIGLDHGRHEVDSEVALDHGQHEVGNEVAPPNARRKNVSSILYSPYNTRIVQEPPKNL
jgi:hypothetical protein